MFGRVFLDESPPNAYAENATMGVECNAICLDCGCQFTVFYGGGFEFNLLRCDTCGEVDIVPIEKAEPSWLSRFFKRLKGPKRCSCGGRFRRDAPIRCVACKSTNIELGDVTMHYD